MLSLSGHPEFLSPGEFKSLITRPEPLWVWVNSRESRILNLNDALLVLPPDARRTGLAIVDDQGRATVALTPTPLEVLGWVGQIWRSGVRIRPARALSGMPPAIWRLYLAFLRLAGFIGNLRSQLRPRPDPSTALADARRLYERTMTSDQFKNVAAAGLTERERIFADRHLGSAHRLLDIGCGAGREAVGFAARGISVTAIDISGTLIEHARKLAPSNVSFLETTVSDGRLGNGSFDAIYISSDLYGGTPGTAGRVAFLRRCGELLRPDGVVMAPVSFARSGWIRLLLDLPRKLFARTGPAPEDGDRWIRHDPDPSTPEHFTHLFFREAEVNSEFGKAGFEVVDRVANWVVGRPGISARFRVNYAPSPGRLLLDASFVLAALPAVEYGRRAMGPGPLLTVIRRFGRIARGRTAAARANLRRVIGAIDRRLPGGGNCYRRSLLEAALDPSASAEPFVFGINLRRDAPPGHAWLGRDPEQAKRYDLDVAL